MEMIQSTSIWALKVNMISGERIETPLELFKRSNNSVRSRIICTSFFCALTTHYSGGWGWSDAKDEAPANARDFGELAFYHSFTRRRILFQELFHPDRVGDLQSSSVSHFSYSRHFFYVILVPQNTLYRRQFLQYQEWCFWTRLSRRS
jgi:hypothetical protein